MEARGSGLPAFGLAYRTGGTVEPGGRRLPRCLPLLGETIGCSVMGILVTPQRGR